MTYPMQFTNTRVEVFKTANDFTITFIVTRGGQSFRWWWVCVCTYTCVNRKCSCIYSFISIVIYSINILLFTSLGVPHFFFSLCFCLLKLLCLLYVYIPQSSQPVSSMKSVKSCYELSNNGKMSHYEGLYNVKYLEN